MARHYLALVGLLMLAGMLYLGYVGLQTPKQVGMLWEENGALREEVATLNRQLLTYEQNTQCKTFRVASLDPYLGWAYFGESELCGFSLQWGEKVWGPSLAAHIQLLEEEIERLKNP